MIDLNQQLDEIRRRVRMIDGELTRLGMATDPALRWVPAETLRMHLDMAAMEMRDYVAGLGGAPAQPASIAQVEADNAMLRDALSWYGEQARLCRLAHSEGDAGRQALDADGGTRARVALARRPRPTAPATEQEEG
ncbi:hypothetical protein [Methylobacterium aquaticum]|uniref:hypothetical protein n=1 Tax=Methylobacterium aquaticum TaxID=270351 RepID=UPI0019314D75|nr:hypothetical protein [Methylobacterium aquaticum]